MAPTTAHQPTDPTTEPAPTNGAGSPVSHAGVGEPTAVLVEPAPVQPAREVSRLKRPRIEREVELPGYQDWTIKAWINFPHAIRNLVTSNEMEDRKAGLRQIVVAHNGWPDDEGFELPQPPSEDFFEFVFSDEPLWTAVGIAIGAARGSVPKSQIERLMRSLGG